MQDFTIQGWFFIIAKNHHPTHDPLAVDCEIKALLGEKKQVIEDKFQLDPNDIITLRVQKTAHRFILKKIHTGSCVFITGKIDPSAKNKGITVEKIKTQIYQGDLTQQS